MKVVAILGGLGSQMVKYAFYLDVRKKCKDEKCIIDTTPYLTMKMWNGYELERIFGIKEEDFLDTFSEDEKEGFLNKSYRKVTMDKMHEKAPNVPLYCIARGKVIKYGEEGTFFFRLKNKLIALVNKYWFLNVLHDDRHVDKYVKNYLHMEGDTYFDEFNHTSDEYFKDVKDEVKKAFTFPTFTDEKNTETSKQMLATESVALHVRRSDHMYDNGNLFTDGYFQKSVNYIKEHVANPEFYIFSEEPDWCKENLEELGLQNDDKIHFVDWNKGEDSFRDMQLMSYCKHNIMVISSFSWWAYYLSQNTEGKVACAPKGYWFDVKQHF